MIRNSRNLFKLQSVRYTSTKGKENFPTEKMKPGYFSDAQNAYMDRVIRVDQAGELGANYIYNGQYLALSHKRPDLKPILKHMWEQEIHHHNTFNNLQVERRVRPSLLTPLWKVGAMGLGIATGLMGKEAAMACTEAVETVIGGHYNQQLRVLTNQFHVDAVNEETEETGETTPTIPEEIKDMQKLVSEFRDEELEHLDTAVEHDAHGARPYWLLTEAIKLTCRGAIWTAERV